LKKHNFKVNIVTTNLKNHSENLNENNLFKSYKGSKIYRLHRFLGKKLLGIDIVHSNIFLNSIIEKSNLVHIHDFRTSLNLQVLKIALQKSVPIIIQPHGSIPLIHINEGKTLFYYFKYFLDFIYKRKYFHKINGIISVTKKEYNLARHYFSNSSKQLLLPNVVQKCDFNHKFMMKKNPIKLGFIGRLNYNKGLHNFLNILTQKFEFQLIIHGPIEKPAYKKKLNTIIDQRALANNVEFKLPIITQRSKDDFFHDIDILIIPSYREEYPTVLLEAIAHKKIIYSTNNSELSKSLIQNEAILFLDLDKEFSDQILDYSEYKLILENLNKFQMQMFSEHQYITKLKQFYELHSQN